MTIEHFILDRSDWVPNNGTLAVILYRQAVREEGEAAALRFETIFAEHDWPPQWRDTVYDYHHYHSTAHEALGIAAGSATLILGGPNGRSVGVRAGDALVLPVGTGHCRIEAGEDFLVVGAYPRGQKWDIRREAPSAEELKRMRELPLPAEDPVKGKAGPLRRLWPSSRETAPD